MSKVSSLSVSVLTTTFPGRLGLADTRMSSFWIFIRAKDDGGGGNKWSYKTCKAPVKLSPPTNQHQTFYRPDALPATQPTVSEHWREEMIEMIDWYLLI